MAGGAGPSTCLSRDVGTPSFFFFFFSFPSFFFDVSPSAAARDLAEIGHKLIFGHFAIGRKRSSWSSYVDVGVRGKYEPAPGISQGNWENQQADWKRGEIPKTDWPAIQGKPFVVRRLRSVKDELGTLGVAALETFLAEGRRVQVCPPKAHGDPQRKPRTKALRRHPPVMKLTWFPDGQAYEAVWENGRLAQYERDKWQCSTRTTRSPADESAARTATEVPFDILPVELRLMALGLPLPDDAQGFALAAE
jgi:hypothetical protein